MTPRPARAAARRRSSHRALAGLVAAVLAVPLTASAAGAEVGGPVPADLATEGSGTVTVLTDDGAGGLDVEVVETSGLDSARALVAREQKSPDVVSASLSVPMQAAAPDPLRSEQWALDDLQVASAWTRTTGVGQVVAVLDTGVDAGVPDLQGVVRPGRSTTGDGGDGRVDGNGHGTHVAGIIAAVPDNGHGIAGLAPGVRVLPVQVLDDAGRGESAWVTAGIVWAADNGATVINMSLGGPFPDESMERAVQYARSKGVVVVAASGNEGADQVSYPAAYPGVLAVGATDVTRAVPAFSNAGSALDVVAPGAGIMSTLPSGYVSWSGTSMAAAYAAAAAALVRAAAPGLTESQVRQRLESTATDRYQPGWDPVSGAGLIDPVRALGSLPGDTTPPAPVTMGVATVGQGTVRLRWTPPADADVAGVTVVRASGLRTIASPEDGVVVHSGTRTDVGIMGLDPRTGHSFAVFARDRAGNLSAPRLLQLQGLRLSVATLLPDDGRSISTRTYGGSVVVQASVLQPDGRAADGLPITFQARPAGASSWATIGRVTSRSGQSRLLHRPTRTTEYRVTYPGATGSPGRIGVATAPRRITVHTAVTATASAGTVPRGTTVTVSGTVAPDHAGTVVLLQRRTSTGWANAAKQTLSSNSTYRFRVSRSTRGSTTYRVVSPADADHGAGTSPARTVAWT